MLRIKIGSIQTW